MGNICATERNKDCLYVTKEPRNIISEFDNCMIYRKKEATRKQLKKKKEKLLRKIYIIDDQLETKKYG
tara:strand:+ start:512 stop:715 length:204 start_codon:yes stop_codon:yes gene_type:complete